LNKIITNKLKLNKILDTKMNLFQNLEPVCLDSWHVTPLYISDTNLVMPLTSLFDNPFYNNIVEFVTIMMEILTIMASTLYFIVNHLVTEISNIMSDVDKVLLAFIIYNFVLFTYKNYKLNNELKNVKSQIERLQMTRRMRDDFEEMATKRYNENLNRYKKLLNRFKKEMNECL
jgi:hypothetical protein